MTISVVSALGLLTLDATAVESVSMMNLQHIPHSSVPVYGEGVGHIPVIDRLVQAKYHQRRGFPAQPASRAGFGGVASESACIADQRMSIFCQPCDDVEHEIE